MSLQFSILGLLNLNEKTGYDLTKVFNSSEHLFRPAQASQVYRDLNTLEKNGYVTHTVVNQTDRPNKKVFSITTQGKKEFFNWLSKYPEDKTLNDSFLVCLFFDVSLNLPNAIKKIEKYKENQCNTLKKLNENKNMRSEVSDSLNNELEFWELCKLKSEYTCEANIKWAEQVIEHFKSKEHQNL